MTSAEVSPQEICQLILEGGGGGKRGNVSRLLIPSLKLLFFCGIYIIFPPLLALYYTGYSFYAFSVVVGFVSGGVLIFYAIFYTVLAALFAVCMQGLLYSINDREPTWKQSESLIGDNPGSALFLQQYFIVPIKTTLHVY